MLQSDKRYFIVKFVQFFLKSKEFVQMLVCSGTFLRLFQSEIALAQLIEIRIFEKRQNMSNFLHFPEPQL